MVRSLFPRILRRREKKERGFGFGLWWCEDKNGGVI
jgi:hypothetical protein